MKTYYIPVSTYNFNTLFETESISPKSYYQIRNFGNHLFRDTSIDAMHLEDNLLLYSELPKTNDNDVMYLKIATQLLVEQPIATMVEGVWAYANTIYFSPSLIEILFLSETQQKDTLIFAQNFSTLKLEKYRNCFKVICSQMFSSYALPIQNVPLNTDKEQIVENDYFFNHLKGLCYGFGLGNFMNEKTQEQKEVLKTVKAISNSLTTFISLLLMKETQKESFTAKNPYEKPNKFYQAPQIMCLINIKMNFLI